MEIQETSIQGLLVITPNVYGDKRGYFFESYRKDILLKSGITDDFVQDNQSKSAKGILRGLHFQIPPHAQSKLVRVCQGRALDVAVDLRRSSPTYGAHYSVELSEDNKKQFYIPRGFAHGFLSLEDDTVFQYKCDGYYNQEHEKGLAWDDPQLSIKWGINDPILSEKDRDQPFLKDFESPFA